MYAITKQVPPPASLTSYRLQVNATYEDMPSDVKKDTKNALLEEQGYVCAYCMNRITYENMRLEHWACQKKNPELQLDYNNMLACCSGNEGQPTELYTCDKKKDHLDLKYSPSNPNHNINARVTYVDNGKIKSSDVDFNEQLESVLNLNESRLVSNRNAALDAVHDMLNVRQGTRKKQEIRSLLERILARDTKNKRKPFFGCLAHYLQSKL